MPKPYTPPDFQFDESDRALVDAHHWHFNRVGHATYVRSTETGEYLHRLLMSPPEGFDVDHRDGKGQNCRRANMRVVSRSQNNMNRRPQRTGAKGIHMEARTGRWRAEIQIENRRIKSARFETECEAIEARRAMESEHHGEFAGAGTAQAE